MKKDNASASSAVSNIQTSELLLWFSRVESKPETAEIDFSSLSAQDWCNFLQQVKYHRLFPVVMSKLNECDTLSVPESVVKLIKAEISEHKKRLLRLNFELVKVATILESEGIETVFYKGPTLSLLAYNSLEGRMFDDLDIWVKSEDYLKPKEILRNHGYFALEYPTLSKEKESEFRYYAGEYTLAKGGSVICIDVHNRILGGGFIGSQKRLEDSWSRCISTQISGKRIKTLCPEDLLIYLCLNGLKDGWESFRVFCDIDRLVRNHPSIDWELICNESRHQSVLKAIRVGISVPYRVLGTPIPELATNSLSLPSKASRVTRVTCDFIKNQMNSDVSRKRPFLTCWLILLALDDPRERIRYLVGIISRSWRLLITVNSRDAEVVKLPRNFYFLYYTIRLFRVVAVYRLRLFKTLLK